MKSYKCILFGLTNLLPLIFGLPVLSEPITLDVKFKLTDIDYKPLPNVLVRIVFGSDKDWQKATAGQRFNTDEKGEAKFTTTANIDKRLRKIPTNFVDSLLSVPKAMDHLMVAADLDYMNFRALYAVDIIVIPREGNMQDHFQLYVKDAEGNFTQSVQPSEYARLRADLGNVILRGPGFEPWRFALDPGASPSEHWKLELGFKRTPPPIPMPQEMLAAPKKP